MRIEVLTSLYPGPPKPHEGIFAELRWSGMLQRGHEVSVVQPLPRTPGPLALGSWGEIRRMPQRELRAGLRVRRPRYLHLPGRARRNARAFARIGMKQILAAGRPDVVVCDYAWPAAMAAPLLAQAGLPCVINGRGSDVLLVAGEAGLGAELSACLKSAGHWCAVSRDLVKVMDQLAGRPGQGCLAPNGVDLDQFRLAERSVARATLGLDPVRPLVLVVGHLIERKDPLLALEAFAVGAPPEAQLVFLGRGPLESAVLARAALLGLEQRVRCLGEVQPSRLASWYTAANLLLLTSSREGRPNVVLEALGSGLPVLATEAGGTRELLEGWSERCLSSSRDAAHLGARLAELLRDPPPAAELRAAVEPLSWENGLRALEACLEAAIAAR